MAKAKQAKPSATQRWLQIAVALVAFYGLGSLAIHSGSLWTYLAAIVCIVFAGSQVVRLFKR